MSLENPALNKRNKCIKVQYKLLQTNIYKVIKTLLKLLKFTIDF